MTRDDIAQYRASETLRNHQSLTIRAIRPDDKPLIVETLVDVSPSSMYRRLFHFKSEFTAEEWKMIIEIDYWNVIQLVAVVEKEGREHIVGGGRCMRSGTSQSGQKAEVAFLVDDRHQGLGIASLLLKHLASIARASGITKFEAEVLPSNAQMLKVFERSGLPVIWAFEEDYIYVFIDLSGDKEPFSSGSS